MRPPRSHRWQQVYDGLRLRIEAGEFQPGDQLPTERDLVEEYSCSRDTVRRAYTALEQAGLVAGRPSTGRRVREPLDLYFDASKFERLYADDPDLGLDQWGQDVAAQGWESFQTVDVAWLPADRHLARWLLVDSGAMLVRRRRIRMVRKDASMNWTPVVVADSWFPLEVANRTVADGTAPLLVERSLVLPGGIMRAIGIRQHTFVDEIRARMPSDEEHDLLRLLPGTPILELARVGMEEDGSRIRVIVKAFNSSCQYLKYVLDVPHPPTESRENE